MMPFRKIAGLGAGKMNLAFADAVHTRYPGCTVRMIGRNDPHKAEALADSEAIAVAVQGADINDDLVAAIRLAGRPVVWASTAFDLANNQILKGHSQPIVYTRNFDSGMQQIRRRLHVIGQMLRTTGVHADIQLVETHDITKKDVSATAWMWKELLGREFEIRSHRIAGALPSHHLHIQFTDGRPDINIMHEVTSRKPYAEGMIEGLEMIARGNLEPGLHRYEDLYDIGHP